MTAAAYDGIAIGASLATLDAPEGYGLVADGAVAWRDGVLAYVGPMRDLPDAPGALAHEVVD